MTKDDAIREVGAIVGDQGIARLTRLVDLILTENEKQNLIARSTVSTIWTRHVLDSIQLMRWDRPGLWIDVGTGGGFPGLAIATVRPSPMMLVEPRRRRADFLAAVAKEMRLEHVGVRQLVIEKVPQTVAAIISARAVGPIDQLFRGAVHLSDQDTRWILPRGAGYEADVNAARADWKGTFHVEQSRSDPDARIVVVQGVTPR